MTVIQVASPLSADPDAEPLLAAGWPRFDQELKRQIRRAWPEMFGAQHPIFRLTQMERTAWRHRYDKGELKAPWCVWGVNGGNAEPGNGACNVVYKPRITVYYISDNVVPGKPDIASYLQEKLSALETVLQAQDYTGFQYWGDETGYDISEENPANGVLVSSNLPMFAGSFTFRAIFGYIAKHRGAVTSVTV